MSIDGNELSDDVLLEICRVSRDDADFSDEFLADLRAVARLVGESSSPRGTRLQYAFTLLTFAVAKLPQFNPIHLPFGYSGPTIRSERWIERETLERFAKQIAGLQWSESKPDAVAFEVTLAVGEAIKVGLLDEKNYDAWRPGMESGSGWRSAISATTYGVTKSRSAFNINGSKSQRVPATSKSEVFYLLSSSSNPPTLGQDTVFYKVTDAAVAQSLCRLFVKEYGGNGSQYHFAVASGAGVSSEDHILLDEVLDELRIYDDPDRGIYDWAPTQQTIDLAQFALRAATWEMKVRSQTTPEQQSSEPPTHDDPAIEPVRNLVAALAELRAASIVLLNAAVAGKSPSESDTKRFHAAELAVAPLLAGISPYLTGLSRPPGSMAISLTESTQALMKAMEPLVRPLDGFSGASPGECVIETAREKLAESMMAELPLFLAVTDPEKLQPHPDEVLALGLAVLLLLAQAYYKILECAVSLASWVTRLDPQLNHYYFWTVDNLKNLLKNHEQLQDFPEKFEPVFPDLNPSTIRDMDWEDMVAPDVEHFLSTVQKYVLSKPHVELRKQSGGWLMVEVFKGSISTAVDYAAAYNARLRQDAKKMFGIDLPASGPNTNGNPTIADSSKGGVAASAERGTKRPAEKFPSEDTTSQEAPDGSSVTAGLVQLYEMERSRDPIAVWGAAETMRSIAAGLLLEHSLVRLGKPGTYEDREKLNRDHHMAQRHGYLLVSVARQLLLDPAPLIRILQEDRLWEYPNEKEDGAIFRAAATIAEKVAVEARIWCAEAGIDVNELVERQHASEGSDAAAPTELETASGASMDPSIALSSGTAPAVPLSQPSPVNTPPEVKSDFPFAIDENALTVTMGGRTARFSGKSTLLFSLMVRISRRPGHRVEFDSLRNPGDVWNNSQVEDETIRGAVKRLRDKLTKQGLGDLASCISTSSFQGRPYVIFDMQRNSNHSSN